MSDEGRVQTEGMADDTTPSFAPHRTPAPAYVLRVVAHREEAKHRVGEACPDCPEAAPAGTSSDATP